MEINPFVDAVKTADPTKLENPTGSITYTFTLTPKQGPLTNVKLVSDEVKIFKKQPSAPSSLTAPTPPETIDSAWTSDTFSFKLDSSMDDSLVINTATFTFTAPDGSPQEIRAVATTIIGNPPTGCFVFSPPPGPAGIVATDWPGDVLAQETAASATIIGSFSSPESLCGPSINVYLASSGVSVNYGGWFMGASNIALDFKHGSVGIGDNPLYTLAHEAGHVYDSRTGISGGSFRQAGLVSWNGSTCANSIYPINIQLNDASCYSENFAEGFTRYITGRSVPNSEWTAWFANNVFKK